MAALTSQSHVIGSIEGPRMLNDHYNIEKYVSRRAMFLGNLYRNTRLDIFKVARGDAAEVFGSTSQDLSVQEIERPEMDYEVEPRLPLPTTANTQTLDDFHSFPDVEWTPGAPSPAPYFDIDRSPSPQVNFGAVARSSRAAAESSLRHPSPRGLQPRFFNLQDLRPYSRLENRNETAYQTANATMALNGPQQTMPANQPDKSSSPFQDTSFSSSLVIDPDLTVATSPMSGQEYSGLMQSEMDLPESDPNQDLVQRIVGRLGTDQAKQATDYQAWAAAKATTSDAPMTDQQRSQEGSTPALGEPNAMETGASAISSQRQHPKILYSTGVSALAGRGMHIPVKTQKRGRSDTPESATGIEEDGDRDEVRELERDPPAKRQKVLKSGNQETQSRGGPPAKKSKLVIKVKRPAPADEDTAAPTKRRKMAKRSQSPAVPAAPSRLSKKKSAKVQASTSTATQPRPSRKREPSRKAAANSVTLPSTVNAANNIEDIVTGDALPNTKAEAKAATEARVARLVASHNADLKSRKKRQLKEGEEPDFMPEHFYVRNFDNENDTVRCVCGDIHNDETPMVQCETCNVWQHMRCVGLPEDKAPLVYDCNVCDPWWHRERIAELRRDNMLP